jgi:hypothetical protein
MEVLMVGARVALMCVIASVVCARVAAASPQQPTLPPAQQPAVPGQPAGAAGAPVPVQTRTFTAPAGLIFTAVRPERVIDFEKVMAYFQAALEKSTDPTVREQAAGWHIFKATETAQGGAVVYVYAIDPAVMGPDYGIGKILADAFPNEAAQLWKMYLGAIMGGGSLLNLTPVMPVEPPPLDAPVKGKPSSNPGAKPTPVPTPVPNP